MTPLARFFGRFLPAPLAATALALTYAGLLFALIVAGGAQVEDIIYIDVRGG